MKRMILVESDSRYNLLQAYEMVEVGVVIDGKEMYRKVGDGEQLFYESGSLAGAGRFFSLVNACMVPKGREVTVNVAPVKAEDLPNSIPSATLVPVAAPVPVPTFEDGSPVPTEEHPAPEMADKESA